MRSERHHSQQAMGKRPASGLTHHASRITPRAPRLTPRASRLAGWLLGKLLALALLAGGGWALAEALAAPELHLSQVTISGNTLVPSKEILAALPLESTNILVVRSRRLQRTLEADPAIATARVDLRLPDTMHVMVAERVPVAVWDTGARRLLSDADGMALRDAPPDGPWSSLSTIHAPEGPHVGPGERVDRHPIRAAQSIVPRLDSVGLAGRQLEYRPTSGIALVYPGEHRVALGFAEDLEPRLAAYLAIRHHLHQTQTRAELVDVRFLNRPYFR